MISNLQDTFMNYSILQGDPSGLAYPEAPRMAVLLYISSELLAYQYLRHLQNVVVVQSPPLSPRYLSYRLQI